MADIRDDLLLAAREAIRAQKSPAYIKCSEMRYLAVNEAFCELFGLSEGEVVGRSGPELGECDGHEDRSEHERRCLVFGADETARYHHSASASSFVISMRRQKLSAELSILVGTFLPATETLANRLDVLAQGTGIAFAGAPEQGCATGSSPVSAGQPLANAGAASAENLLDAIGTGVAIYDRAGALIHANQVMRAFYKALLGEVADADITMHALLQALYEVEAPDAVEDARDDWISQRLAEYELPLFERVSRTVAGGWMRLVTQRRADGTLVALRSDVTAMKENEGRLRQQGQEIGLYRALLDELPVATFVRDEAQRLVFANRAFLELTGLVAADVLGKTTLEMFPDQGDEFHARNQSVLDGGELVEAEADYRRPDGQVIPTIARSYRVISADNHKYLIGSITDTSMLKRREEQLIEARRQAEEIKSDLESIVASLHVGIVVVDENSTIELVNSAFESLWNGKLPALIGKPFDALLRFKKEQGETIGTEADVCDTDHQVWLRRVRDGGFPTREVGYANGRTLIESGQPISGGRCLLTYIDITERREHEREVLETRSALEEVGSLVKDAMAAMSQGLLIIDKDHVELANEALLSMVDIAPELLRPGAAVADIIADCRERGIFGFSGDQRVSVENFRETLLRDRRASITLLSGKGSWLQMEARPTEHGRIVFVFSDISQLKEREDELRRLVVRAETADKAKSEFLANMSHEIRTPMNGVLGMAELLAKSNLDTRQKTFIDIMVKSGNALLTIINDVLDFSKIDAGQMTLRKAPFNALEAVEDVATLLAAKAAEKDIELVVRAAADMPAVLVGDAGRFRQIVTNLVGNAVKFTDFGHVRIDMAAREAEDGRIDVTLTVEDTGTGIPEDKLASVFEKFSQVDSSSTRRHEGTGLGLAITHGLVTLFGGALSVTSTVGKGSAFTVTLPFEVDQLSASNTAVPANLRGARILVADRSDATRTVARELLSEWGFDVTAVANAEEALAVLSAASAIEIMVEAVIVDRNIRDGNGRSLIEAIRKEFPETAVIAVSTFGGASPQAGLDACEAEAHLMKPVRAGLLRETVCEVVRAARRRASGHGTPVEADGGIVVNIRQPAPAAPAEEEGTVDVLVAEDNEVNQLVFRQLLEGLGVGFTVVANGEEAVQAYKRLKPRLILMDVSMPVMNGHQAARAIRSLEAGTRDRVPIVAVTAHVLDGDRESCLESGMDDYLTKPISTDRLEEMLGRWMDLSAFSAARRSTLH
ncbi:PAS-domain containing protein [Mycoplana sp. MJR14]|uniref:PAS-domain containing protein n=1 Tax=Mycoplana sp. MJR14 TaxID=3032583 RepID=UPI0023DA64D8|nr:PAS-domain containing protein [Mycoplana sp. MJR14]MDF1634793.1 PAS-domain containing protein [Mycoplana sp. MJR14]